MQALFVLFLFFLISLYQKKDFFRLVAAFDLRQPVADGGNDRRVFVIDRKAVRRRQPVDEFFGGCAA